MSDKIYLNAKQYLNQLQVLDTKINQKLEELAALKIDAASTGGIDYSRDRVQTSGTGDTVGNAVVRCCTLNEEINREIDTFYDAKHLMINQIQELNVNDYIQVLYKTYVQYMTLKTVAHEIGRSYQYTRELHKKALDLFEQKHKKLSYLT